MSNSEIFTGQDLLEAINKGEEATLEALIDDCKELMKYDDGYEAMKLLQYYIEKNCKYNIKLIKKVNDALDNYYIK